MTIEEIQDRFHECFPNLEIIFYTVPFRKIVPFNNPIRLNQNERIESVRQFHHNGALEIKSWFLIGKVERDLRELFDLNAHIFRIDPEGNLIGARPYDALLCKQ